MAYITMHVEGYITVEVNDNTDDEMMREGNQIVSDEDFGNLRDIEWQVHTIEHENGSITEYR